MNLEGKHLRILANPKPIETAERSNSKRRRGYVHNMYIPRTYAIKSAISSISTIGSTDSFHLVQIERSEIMNHEIVMLFMEYSVDKSALPWEVVASWAAKGRLPFLLSPLRLDNYLGEAELRWIYAYRCYGVSISKS